MQGHPHHTPPPAEGPGPGEPRWPPALGDGPPETTGQTYPPGTPHDHVRQENQRAHRLEPRLVDQAIRFLQEHRIHQ